MPGFLRRLPSVLSSKIAGRLGRSGQSELIWRYANSKALFDPIKPVRVVIDGNAEGSHGALQATDVALHAYKGGGNSTQLFIDAGKVDARGLEIGLHLLQPLPNHIEGNFAHTGIVARSQLITNFICV
jgi:hypothetical protein